MKKLFILIFVILAVAAGWFVVYGTPPQTDQNPSGGKQAASKEQLRIEYRIEYPTSRTVVVNKLRSLSPIDYVPTDLVTPNVPLRLSAGTEEMKMRREAATALEKMFTAAKNNDNLELMVASAYRSYNTQKELYDYYVSKQGKTVADSQSARAGHSEHQTGWAVDVEPASGKCEVEECFADTPEGKWVAKHAHEYGFIIRYGKDKEYATGYIFEPWHLRYVGKALSEELHKQGNPTLEEFFGVSGVY
jgi:zinc D-Ala-D-Ala carboxypeptidase